MSYVPPRYILAPYVATPPEIVQRMVELAEVRPDDTVYDLGCGDGRLLIAAAQRGAGGVGIDVEPWWVEQAQQHARAAGVAARLRFVQGDATEFDLSAANVVFLYLVHWSTQLVLAKLRRECASGTRVVSHSFGFDGLANVHSESIPDAEGGVRRIHRWVLGPDAA